MATELHVAFPQFSLEAIIAVVEAERTSDASAMKLMEMDDERNRILAEQYHAATMKHMQEKATRRADVGPPPVYTQLSVEEETTREPDPKGPELQPEEQPLPTVTVVKTPTPESPEPISMSVLYVPNEPKPIPVVNMPEPLEPKPISILSIPEETPSYSDFSSPAVDRLLRGFGGRERHAPEKSTEYSLPASNVEEGLKENIKTTDTPHQQITAAEDLATKKEARRKARRDRRERQQQQREALAKATSLQTRSQRRRGTGDSRASNQLEIHITNHNRRDQLLPSISSPAINMPEPSDSDPFKIPHTPAEFPDDITSSMISITEDSEDMMQSSRYAASSGYDTGSEWYLDSSKDSVDVRPKQREPQQCEDYGDREDEETSVGDSSSSRKAVKYKCGSKYETANKSGRIKPSKYESKKSKKYNSRRKTLTFDHYSTDHQDRSSM